MSENSSAILEMYMRSLMDKSIQSFAVRTFAKEHTTTSTQHLHAFWLQRTRDFLLINLKDIKPLNFIYFNDNMYVNPRYKIM